MRHAHPLLSLLADGVGCGDGDGSNKGVAGGGDKGVVRMHHSLGQLHDLIAHRATGDRSPMSSLLRAELLVVLLELAADLEGVGPGQGQGQGLMKDDVDGDRSVTVLARGIALLLLSDVALDVRQPQPQLPQPIQTSGGRLLLPPPLPQPTPPPPQELLLLGESLRALVALLGPTPTSSPCLDPSSSSNSSTNLNSSSCPGNKQFNKNTTTTTNNNDPLEALLLFLGSDK